MVGAYWGASTWSRRRRKILVLFWAQIGRNLGGVPSGPLSKSIQGETHRFVGFTTFRAWHVLKSARFSKSLYLPLNLFVPAHLRYFGYPGTTLGTSVETTKVRPRKPGSGGSGGAGRH
eukprot:3684980-Rhodomonas_salina.1